MFFLLAGVTVQSYGQGTNRPTGGATQPSGTTTPAATATQAPVAMAPGDNGSARPTPESDLMFKRTLWRVVNLKEKQNIPLFALNHEISKIIIDAVKKGELMAYKNDSLTKPLTGPEFGKSLAKGSGEPSAEEIESLNQARSEWNEIQQAKKRANKNYVIQPFNEGAAGGGVAEYLPKEIDRLEIKENVIFDKKRSQIKYDIQAVTLYVKNTDSGLDQPLGSFAYKDLAKVFRDHSKDAIWYNTQNEANHLNLADAFELRMFSSYIKKVSNPADDELSTIHGGSQQAILASQRAMEELVEFESSLWSH